jgi:hypothetical protein
MGTSLCSPLRPPHYFLIFSAPSWGQPASSPALPPTFGGRQIRIELIL